MPSTLTQAEKFLVDFHDRHPGITSDAFKSLRAVKAGEAAASSYQFLASIVPIEDRPISLLDLACGDGHLLALIASSRKTPTKLVGIDISVGELAAAEMRLGPCASLVRARAQEIPLVTGSMDFVLCHMALMLMDDLDSVIEQVRRVLRLGGVFSFVVGAKPPSSAALDLYIARLRTTRKILGTAVPTLGDRRLANPEHIQQLLSKHFNEISCEDISIIRRYKPSELWEWFEGMYDLHGIPALEQATMRSRYIEELSPLCEEDGKLEFTDYLRQVRAVAAYPLVRADPLRQAV